MISTKGFYKLQKLTKT